jgi:2-keto-4-pentenoate hydratase/2-oxohepta-3-ene-1,7-dioic acid hydratase in catechol pathway
LEEIVKIVLFNDHRPGLLKNDNSVVDISGQVQMGRTGQETLSNIIENWDSLKPRLESHLASQSGVPLSSVQLRAPVPKPGKIMCMAANYREGTDKPPLPINGFLVSPDAILDPGGTTVLPEYQFTICHHEAELVCVIGKKGKDISQGDAYDHVFGYTAGVDVSARGAWGYLSKAYDGFKPIGPCIVTKDEIPNPHSLQVRLQVDGQPRQDYNTSDIGHPIPECFEYFSKIMTFLPGDLLFVGTNHQQLGPLQDGETCHMEIDKIGGFDFKVSDPYKRSWPKAIDPTTGQNVRRNIEEAAASGR